MTIQRFLQPLIITVEENETVLDDTADKLGFEAVRVSSFCTFVLLSIG